MSAAKDPATAIDLVEMTVEGAQAGFASGAFTSESLTEGFLERIAIYNPPYNAIVFMNPGALDDARSSDARRASGKSIGPLDGVPVVVKDAMDMAGFPTTGGWRLLHSKTGGVDLYPATDAPVVARMRAAGSLLHGGLEWRVGALRRYPSCDADEFGLPELAHSVERFDRDGNLGHTSGVVA